MPAPADMAHARRFAVVGATGSGKTTFARELAQRLAIPHVELDALHWGPDWTEVDDELFRKRTSDATSADAWVVDGNYHQVRDIVWVRAEALVWLDLPFRTVAWRLTKRIVRRSFSHEELWSGNRERLSAHLFTRDSLYLWLLKTYWRRKRQFPELLALPEHAHLTVARLTSAREVSQWLDVASGPSFEDTD